MSTGGTVLDDGEDVTFARALRPPSNRSWHSFAYHHRFTTDPESMKAVAELGSVWLASVERVDEKSATCRFTAVMESSTVSNGHDALVDVSVSRKQTTFTGTREELRERLAQLEARGATGIIFGTSGYDVERELRAYAEVAGLR